MAICKICNKTYKALGTHISHTHNLPIQEYYDKYLLKDDENICVVCGKSNKFISIVSGYTAHCSCTCTQLDSKVRNKQKETNLARYGVEHPAQSAIVKDKRISTNIERYGVANVYQSKEIKLKIKSTNLSRYGVEHPMQNSDIQLRLKKSIQDKYGVEYSPQSPIVKQHSIENSLKIYGVEHHITSKQCIYKSKKTKLERHKNILSIERLSLCEKEIKKANSYEQQFFNSLKVDYSILYNVSSKHYPYLCDFYIEELDLYIELNLTWTHGCHYFDETLDKDTMLTMYSKNNSYYNAAIDTWTITDIEKRDCAIQNRLNYVVLWNKDHIDQFLDDIKTNNFIGFIDYNVLSQQ